MLQIKRAYLAPNKTDGYRVLVDRIWPRGKSKENEKIDCWLKEIAPSTDLRKWFNHEAEKYTQFKSNYLAELQNDPQKKALKELKEILSQHETVTLVYGAKNEEQNNAQVLYELLTKF
ncbi:DUF488 domain-containing protein [Enterococcus hermanniensis]|uniref:MarR family transcriptional regulator n=1 Tax=Enterococcus hermanniensis TaxID=249189 RepID=A0A1L8TQ42_9ENTE|nr:DUF488 family protein [Enterococcus hermanniensis]OJG46298.1 hypothetical protein RV04_GL001464 [Enterococcus hermanniensis]